MPIAPSPHTIPTRPTAVGSTREPALAALCIALYTQQAVQQEATQVVTHCDYYIIDNAPLQQQNGRTGF